MSTHPDGDTAPAAPGHLDATTVLDVRSAAEFETTHIPGSINVPLPVLEAHADAIAARLDGPVLLVCNSGMRASQAQRHLAVAGVTNTSALHGGIGAHQAAGGELVHGRARWALERQVRVIAGTLVLVGLSLGQRIPKARLLAAGIGAGLTISALTDTCAMGQMLAALPYNRDLPNPDLAAVLSHLPTVRTQP